MKNNWHPKIKNTTALLTNFGWGLEAPHVDISPGISISKFEGSDAEQDYYKICHEYGHDGSEPFGYSTIITVHMDKTPDHTMDVGAPQAAVERFCNILSIAFSQPPYHSQYMIPYSSGILPLRVGWLFPVLGNTTDFLDMSHKSKMTLDMDKLKTIRTMWLTADRYWHDKKAHGRLNNALFYYYYAWTAPDMEQTCINLGITLETLFTPHAFGELTHQLSFNLAHFLGKTNKERVTLYKQTKDFYGIRSSIVHGGKTNEIKAIDHSVEMFKLTSNILCAILSNTDTADIFNSDEKRKVLFNKYLFN